MGKAVFRYEIPLDDKWHPLPPGKPLHVEVGRKLPGRGEIWMEVRSEMPETPTHQYRVFGTGHTIPDTFQEIEFVGTARNDPFMWHFYRREIA